MTLSKITLIFVLEYKIPIIENLGATLDQFDTINFTSNEIRKIDNFPLLPRLKSLLFNNNRIVRIADGLEESLPNLRSMILTNNNIQELADIEKLAPVQTLECISLLHNPVVAKSNYRAFVIHKFPNLRVLDFKKVKLKEKEEAKALFKSRKGKEQLQEIKRKAKTFVPGANLPDGKKTNASGLTPEQVKHIKEAISKATTLDEIERLNHMLRTGNVPNGSANGQNGNGAAAVANNGEEVEEMDED